MASLFGFGSVPVDVEIRLLNESDRKHVELSKNSGSASASGIAIEAKEVGVGGGALATTIVPGDGSKSESAGLCPIYYDGESVVGQVVVRLKDGKKLQHEGIKLELIGSIESFYDR